MKRSGDRRGTRLRISATNGLLVFTVGIMTYLSWSGSFRNGAALIQRKMATQTMSVVGKMDSPTPTSSWYATPTATQPRPAAPPPSQKLLLSYTFIPAVVYLNNPPAILSDVPSLTSTAEPSPTAIPLSPTRVPYARKTILVDISDQHVYAYEKGKLIFSFVASTGRKNSTRVGHYKILDKHPKAFSDPWGFWMPYWMGIYYAGSNLENGFHSLPVLSNGVQIWGKKIGSPITYGCVVLKPKDMKKLYRWAGVGTAVVIQK